VNMLVEITERKHKEEHISLLAREVDHRSKNLLALVFATVRLTQADTIDDLRTAIEGRLKALANAHALLAQSRWVSADLHTLVAEEVRPYCLEGRRRAEMKGPTLVLSPETAQSVAIALHELTTNAVKYGSLSVPTGHVQIKWSHTDDGRITLLWVEEGGPAATQPAKRGFGTTVIDRMICDRLNGSVRFDWRREGLVCEIILHDLAPLRDTSQIRPGASAPRSHYETSPPVDFSGRSTVSSPG
jgi:two-component sensor histidine kinase